jgi:Family of unknown function (DUF5990)/Domain of unknown function (DUF5655)
MPQLPDHPDLDQLRRQARELHRAAARGEAPALARVHAVSPRVTLSAAQLALARDYGFPSWNRLRDMVQRRRAGAPEPGRERPAFINADADELISGQYADRPPLRPVLDTVLAALPRIGDVTVQARKTVVSLVSPRRTFAAVQATTKSRVDLGLRLDGVEPAGRVLEARNIASGTINLRIPLSGPGDVDDEVVGWLKRAYDQSLAPPAPRRPARRPVPELGPMTVLIDGYDLPGLTCHPEPDGTRHQNIHVALHMNRARGDRPALVMPGRPGLAAEPVPGDAPAARWELEVTVRRGDEGFDFGGLFVRGDRSDRHLGLAWGDVPGDGTLRLFRGAKLRLVDVDPGLIEDAMRPGHRLVARIRLTDPRGNPVCARVHPPALTWSAGKLSVDTNVSKR